MIIPLMHNSPIEGGSVPWPVAVLWLLVMAVGLWAVLNILYSALFIMSMIERHEYEYEEITHTHLYSDNHAYNMINYGEEYSATGLHLRRIIICAPYEHYRLNKIYKDLVERWKRRRQEA